VTAPTDDGLVSEIAFAEETLRDGLAELAAELRAGKSGQVAEELVQHCREIAEILTALVRELGAGANEDATREAMALMLGRLAQLEGHVKRAGLH